MSEPLAFNRARRREQLRAVHRILNAIVRECGYRTGVGLYNEVGGGQVAVGLGRFS